MYSAGRAASIEGGTVNVSGVRSYSWIYAAGQAASIEGGTTNVSGLSGNSGAEIELAAPETQVES